MKAKNIDLLNIFLMFISLYLAFKIPFELFLFSYTILGPLHYLTEINWLKDNNYFVKAKYWTYAFVLIAALISIPVIIKLPSLQAFNDTFIFKQLLGFSRFLINVLILSSLLFAIGLVHFKKWQHILLFFLISVISSIMILKFVPFSIVVVGVFLPTIIHVYLFTLLFMIFGMLNSKTSIGIIGILFFILCPILIIVSHIDTTSYIFSETSKTVFTEIGFTRIKVSLAKIFRVLENGQLSLLSEGGIKIQIFIAFAYTYHYLNWFSKTSIIGWSKNLSKSKLIVVISIWIISVLLYLFDYKTGLMALFFLSYLHVLLEFPLNIISIKGIFLKLYIDKNIQKISPDLKKTN